MGKPWRLMTLCLVMGLVLIGILWRLIDLNTVDQAFLLKQSQARIVRYVKIPAYRGIIFDRLGSPLAVSTRVESVWVNPHYFSPTRLQLKKLSLLLQMSTHYIQRHVKKSSQREFVYLKRSIPPPLAKRIKDLKISGVYFQRAFRRYYPEGRVMAHVVGFTNVDDQGQEGLELGFNRWLSGRPGKEKVVKDRLGNIIAELALQKAPLQGKNLQLSIDHRIQYLTYRSLKAAVERYHAESGSAVVMDVKTGEVLAMVNQPSYNPNNRQTAPINAYRNRAVTDMFELGSVMKPFTIALALQSGRYTPDTKIDTHSGWMEIGGYRIRDDLNYGVVTLTQLLQKSSNIAAAKILLSLDAHNYWYLLKKFGFGERTQSGFPGEASGQLVPQSSWVPSVLATLAYGYGISVTTLQLAHAYSVIADGGVSHPVSLLKVNPENVSSERVLSPKVAHTVVRLLETVVEKGGTGTRAEVPGYRVAGKTGTAYLASANGYDHHRYMASFAGIAPASKPQLVVVVVLKTPQGQHFGGLVAAPAFSQIMSGALRLLDVPPDGDDFPSSR